jgi:hypothetical protein
MKKRLGSLAVLAAVLCFALPAFATSVPEGSGTPMLAVSGLVLLGAVVMKRILAA